MKPGRVPTDVHLLKAIHNPLKPAPPKKRIIPKMMNAKATSCPVNEATRVARNACARISAPRRIRWPFLRRRRRVAPARRSTGWSDATPQCASPFLHLSFHRSLPSNSVWRVIGQPPMPDRSLPAGGAFRRPASQCSRRMPRDTSGAPPVCNRARKHAPRRPKRALD
jgi:hypothetical protein